MTTQNRITDQGYTGTVVFYKNIKYGYLAVTDCTEEEFKEGIGGDGEHVFLGSCDVDVKFDTDTREAEIAGLEKQRENIRAELGRQIAIVEERISKLRALPHFEGVAS